MRPSLLVLAFVAAVPVACNKSAPRAGVAVATTPGAPATTRAYDPAQLANRLKANTPENCHRALEMVREMEAAGQDPVPTLLDALQDPTSGPLGSSHPDRPTSTRETAVVALLELEGKGKKALNEQGISTLEKGLRDKKPEVREHTVSALGLIGPDARAAAPAVTKLGADSQKEVRQAAYRTLERLKPVPAGPILRYLSHPDPAVALEAAEALRWLKPTGADAVEPLLAALRRQPRAKQEPSDITFIRNAAAEALAGVGPEAEAAVPGLVEMLVKAKKEDVEAMVRPGRPDQTAASLAGPVLALRQIGKPAAAAVVPLLKHNDALVRFQAAAVLSGMKPAAGADALPAVQAAMEAERTLPNGELFAFEEMVTAVLNLGGEPDTVIAQLIELLKSEQEIVRFRSAKLLARIGRKASAAVPQLTELLKDSQSLIQQAVLEALGAIGPAARDAVPEMGKKVESEDIAVAREATRALRALGPVAAPAVPHLARALDSNDSSFCTEAAQAIAAVGPEATAAVEAIARHLGDAGGRREEKLALLDAAAAMGPAAKEAIPPIIQVLGEREVSLRMAAAETLGKVGPGNPDVIRALTGPLADRKNTPLAVQVAILKALAGMGTQAQAAAPDVKALAEQAKDPGIKVWIAATLVALGTDIGPNTQVVLAALKDRERQSRFVHAAAVEAAGLLGAKGSAAVPELVEVLKDRAQPGAVREKAARSLGALRARGAIRPLTDALHDPSTDVRRAAAEALGALGADAITAAPKLRDLIKTDPEVAAAARAALEKIAPEKKAE